MTIQRMIELLAYERKCVESANECDRNCAECNLVQDTDELLEMYNSVITLLKAKEPRVMTLSNLRDIGSVWELNTPPHLWMDINPSYRWTRGFWVAWREIYDMIDGLHPTYDADNYGKIWRCWTTRPTVEQMNNTPWEERDSGEKAE